MSDPNVLLLQNELASRISENSRYSLRAFAQSLHYDVSALSRIMRGKQKLGLKAGHRLLGQLGLRPSAITPFDQVPEDKFELIAEWYYFAILEYLLLPGASKTTDSIARALGLSQSQTYSALLQLKRAGFLENNGKNTTSKFSSEHARVLQKQFLKRAADAIESVSIEQRDNTGLTLRFSKKDFCRAKEMLQRFRNEFQEAFGKSKSPDEVYQLTLAFFPLTKSSKRRRES